MTAPRRPPWSIKRDPEPDPPSPIEYLRSRGGQLAAFAERAAQELDAERAGRPLPDTQLTFSDRRRRRDHRAAAAGNER